jgi:hypothetical protein
LLYFCPVVRLPYFGGSAKVNVTLAAAVFAGGEQNTYMSGVPMPRALLSQLLKSSKLFKRSLAIVAVTCIAPFAHSGPITLDLQPGTAYAGNGDTVALDLVVSGLGDFSADSLGAFDITVGFDASALTFNSYSLGYLLGDVSLSEALDGSAGDIGGGINVTEVSLLSVLDLDALQPDSFILATLNFDVTNLAPGTSTELAVLQGPILADAFGAQLTVEGLGSASISNVPVSGTLLLFIASCFSWRFARRPVLQRK